MTWLDSKTCRTSEQQPIAMFQDVQALPIIQLRVLQTVALCTSILNNEGDIRRGSARYLSDISCVPFASFPFKSVGLSISLFSFFGTNILIPLDSPRVNGSLDARVIEYNCIRRGSLCPIHFPDLPVSLTHVGRYVQGSVMPIQGFQKSSNVSVSLYAARDLRPLPVPRARQFATTICFDELSYSLRHSVQSRHIATALQIRVFVPSSKFYAIHPTLSLNTSATLNY
ncbi:hypothetical protein B0H14DRAFT_2557983 [Mycena olivaceomarginata]|nr:hypothetical protein B0H14DRAFT_2557983 [Mycena olivaceomarginata]